MRAGLIPSRQLQERRILNQRDEVIKKQMRDWNGEKDKDRERVLGPCLSAFSTYYILYYIFFLVHVFPASLFFWVSFFLPLISHSYTA